MEEKKKPFRAYVGDFFLYALLLIGVLATCSILISTTLMMVYLSLDIGADIKNMLGY